MAEPNAIDLLGITKEELTERVIARICSQVIHGEEVEDFDDDGDPVTRTRFHFKLNEVIKNRIDAAVEALGKEHIEPNVKGIIEDVVLQETTSWGEKKGEPKTFTQYLIERAEHYLTEEVDHRGSSLAERRKRGDTYGWKADSTRLTFIVHKYFHYEIEQAMKEAVKTANDAIAEGIQGAVKIKLEEITKALKVKVEVK